MRPVTKHRKFAWVYAVLLSVVTLSPSWAGDSRHGKIIAQRWCAACHVVVLEQSTAWADAPSFSDIARRRVDKDALARFLSKRPMPTYLNGMARGALSNTHPSFMSRSRRAALTNADVVLVFGTPFDFRVDYGREGTWAKDVKVIQVDLDARELGRNRHVDVGIPADTGHTLAALEEAMQAKEGGEWLAKIRKDEDGKQAKIRAEITSGASSPPNPLWVCNELAKYVEQDTIIVGDGGDFVATAANTMPVRWPGLWMDPGPLGTLGVGPGYAMAAKLVRPGSRVILVYGDGSFGLHAMEFEAMARQGIKVVAVIGKVICCSR
jgi:acetolactate synthase-1/2/3 large subunit